MVLLALATWTVLVLGVAATVWWRSRRRAVQLSAPIGVAARGRFEPVGDSGPAAHLSDVAGMHRVKAEVQDVIAFLRDGERFRRMGARTPRGILLEGPPGTGKTLLARAVAGESGARFFQAAASEFVEMYVGVGAARVRQLFDAARKQRPAIIFIDELDAVGARQSGGHQEDVRTITQLLREIDGFLPLDGVVVLAATNRADALDPALLRPGRFDRVITVDLPSLEERREILAVHAHNKPFAPGVDPLGWAEATAGFAGANLEGLLNEASLVAIRCDRWSITDEDLQEAYERTVAGIRSERALSPEERRLVAYHEAGHAVCAWFTPGASALQYVSILPRSRSLGQTVPRRRESRIATHSACRAELVTLFGGRAAELVVYGQPTSGAATDLRAATSLARRMVGEWGMGDHLATTAEADGEAVRPGVERLLADAEAAAEACLRDRRDRLEALATVLLEQETIDGDGLERLLGGGCRTWGGAVSPPVPSVGVASRASGVACGSGSLTPGDPS